MSVFKEDQISGKVLDHLGLVASTIDTLGLIDKIDSKLPVSKQHGAKVTMGERVSAMLLNGLGFIDDRLYMFPKFLENKPVEELLGQGLQAEWFNDDALGRCLDAISDYGVTKLFTEVSFDIGIEQGLLGKTSHIDSSTLSLHGEYDSEILDDNPLPAHGHSKARRPDLKQMVINLATTGKAAFPIWMEAHSGNASDKVILQAAAKRMDNLCSSLEGVEPFLHVGDSAMYSKCVSHGGNMRWLSRAPESINAVKELVQRPDEDFIWIDKDDHYRYCEVECCYKTIHQRWLIVSSKHAYEREIKTLEKNIGKEYSSTETSIKRIGNKIYKCSADAASAAQEAFKKLKYHQVNYNVEPITKYPGKGRPAKDAKPETVGYSIKSTVSKDEGRIRLAYNQKGRFILATNELNRELLSSSEMLDEYKAQSKTESGFKFIKDDTFEVDSIFLKNPSRISALMMVMTLCLMVYSVAQHTLRQSLKASDKTVPNQKGQDIKNPTMKWIYRLFHGVQLLHIEVGSRSQKLVINLNALLKRIISYFGSKAQIIYNLPSG